MTSEESPDKRLIEAVLFGGDTKTVQMLLAAGADVHAKDDCALCGAAWSGNTEMVQVLLAAGADIHIRDEAPLWWALKGGHMEVLQVLAQHVFTPDAWREKSRAEIEAEANAIYDKIKIENPEPEHLQRAGTILFDCAMQCWEQIRPAPPKIQISPLPAQPKPL